MFHLLGVVKVSPAHSAVDFEIARNGSRLEVINVLADDGTINERGGPHFAGLPRFRARSELVKRLADKGLYRGRFNIGERAEYLAPVGLMSLPLCSRSGDVVEPLLREQWFINTSGMAAAAIEVTYSVYTR